MEVVWRHRMTQKLLKESQEWGKILFEKSVQGILVTNFENFKFLFANPAICRMLGYTEGEFLELGIADLHPQRTVGKLLDEIRTQSPGEGTSVFNIPCLKKDRTIIFANISGTVVDLFHQKCAVGFFTDVTQQLITEKNLNNAIEQIRKLTGLLPICAYCKKIRDDELGWSMLDEYILKHSAASLSHGICPECEKKYWSDDLEEF